MWLVVVGCALGAASPTTSAEKSPLLLPPVTVQADVPLVKVAELSMLEPRFGPAAVLYEDFVYIVGGMNADDVPSRTIERFNLRTGGSEIFARLKFPRFWHGAVVSRGKLYVIGGVMFSDTPLPPDPVAAEQALAKIKPKRRKLTDPPAPWVPIHFVEVVNLETGAVENGIALPKPVYSFGCVAVSDQIAVVGGNLGSGGKIPIPTPSSRLSIFDPEKGGWTLGPMLPRARMTAVVAQGPLVLAAGGYTGAETLADVDVFDLREGVWRSLKPLVRPTSAHSMVVLDDHLFLFGDYAKPDELISYDLRRETSDVFTLGYNAARHTAAVTHERKIYVIGGRALRVSAPLKTIQVFALRKDLKTKQQ